MKRLGRIRRFYLEGQLVLVPYLDEAAQKASMCRKFDECWHRLWEVIP